MKYIGLDIHKKDAQCCVLDEKGKIVHVERIRTDVKTIGHWFGMIEAKVKDELSSSKLLVFTSGSTTSSPVLVTR